MTDIQIEVTFDYVDPGSYLAHELLMRWSLNLESAVSITWTPLELRLPTSSPIDVHTPEWSSLTRAMAAFAEFEEIPFTPPTHVPWTRKAHELALHAADKDCFEQVHAALFRAYFSTGRDIGRVDVLTELGQEAGLEPAETRTVLGVDRFAPAVERARNQALDREVRGVPTLEAGDRRLEGFKHPEAFRTFLETLVPGPASSDEHLNE